METIPGYAYRLADEIRELVRLRQGMTKKGLSSAAIERAMFALLTRYHRKGSPDIDDYKALLDKDDEAILIRLAAILRLAEYLERGRNGAVEDVSVTWTDHALRLALIADTYPVVELWEAEQHAVPLVKEAF